MFMWRYCLTKANSKYEYIYIYSYIYYIDIIYLVVIKMVH